MEIKDEPFSDPIQKLTASYDDRSKRLDIFVSEKTGLTRSQALKLIKNGRVLVNSSPQNANYRMRDSDRVDVFLQQKNDPGLLPEAIPLKIHLIDDFIAVVDKPAGMVVYPAAGHSSGTLLNAIAHYAPKMASVGGAMRPGVVHRLDKDTSGVMVVALDDGAYYNLVEQFRNRTIYRKYVALVSGELKNNTGEIILSVGRSDSDRKKMSTRSKRGKNALTSWTVIQRFNNATLIEARLGTGRTHQIRVHFAAIGHPVLGDITYGKKTSIETKNGKIIFPRQMLHAETLGFYHPYTKKWIEFSSPIPDDMKECIDKLL